jgi:glycosyltransferase involved in cell wall biosynthesis
MNKVCIGIPIDGEPERFLATLASIRSNTADEFQLLLLPDGPDHATAVALADHREIPLLATAEPRGGAACFNRLAQYNDADFIILLESGALVGPGWLDHLLWALNNDSHNGLVGPSTNRSWNDQAVFSPAKPPPTDVAAAAADVSHRFGTSVRTLEPLFSLGDFCYGVRREVIETIGLADEGYGLGPCWEMDYNIRAARAGWRGVWACAAYVHRAPFTASRQRDEARLFESSKRRYQDRFCGARLRGEKSDYRLHCRGDACPNFAPANLIRISNPFSAVPPIPLAQKAHPQPGDVQIVSERPLVSCIMPTCDRLQFVPEAVRCFQRQDYPSLELIVVDDGAQPVRPLLPPDPRIRLISLPEKQCIGAKRNIACASAHGELIVHWDDDDWYPRDRVSLQAEALERTGAVICGTSILFYYEPATDRAWQYRFAGGRAWVAGNTLAYRKSWWAGHRLPEIQVGEDSRFVWAAAPDKVCDLRRPGLCVARIHEGNTSRKTPRSAFWEPRLLAELKELLGDEWLVFAAREQAAQVQSNPPLVSSIMPTRNRRSFLPLALQTFLAQDYPNRELVIVEDGEQDVSDMIRGLACVRYLRAPPRSSIGHKRNLACQSARGDIIAHWDDDDWYGVGRLSHQVAPLLAGRADLTGLENAFQLELASGEFWRPTPEMHRRMFVGDLHGGTLVYWKKLFAEGMRYPEVNLAEDASFLLQVQRRGKRILRLENPGLFVYTRHGHNSWRFPESVTSDPHAWQQMPRPETFSEHLLSAFRDASNTSDRTSRNIQSSVA